MLAIVIFGVFQAACCLQRKSVADPLPYAVFAMLVMFLFSGVSVHVMQFTGNTWIPMLLFGMVLSLKQMKEKEMKEEMIISERSTGQFEKSLGAIRVTNCEAPASTGDVPFL